MFTLLFGLIKGFFKLIGSVISFIIGFVVLIVLCVCFAKACGDFTYDAYQTEKSLPHNTQHECPQRDYFEQNSGYYQPQTQPSQPQQTVNFQYNKERFGTASYMFEEYHFIHQFSPGTYVACPVCHKQFYKHSIDNCFCTNYCWQKYNDIVYAWNNNDCYEVERLGKRYDKYDH